VRTSPTQLHPPLVAGDEKYIPDATGDERLCMNCNDVYCTRPRGHDGNHVAHGPNHEMLAIWPRKTRPMPRRKRPLDPTAPARVARYRARGKRVDVVIRNPAAISALLVLAQEHGSLRAAIEWAVLVAANPRKEPT